MVRNLYDTGLNPKVKFVVVVASTLLAIGLVWLMGWGIPTYRVWQQEMSGRAKLAEAEWSRKIAIAEAEAKRESAKSLAAAEIERARGVAEANNIIGKSLSGNNEYLHYLWIMSLQDDNNKIIYVPTEANLPVTEAVRTQTQQFEN